MNEKPDIIGKIEKLLRLAGSTNAHEAALAMAKAMELADRHAIDLHKIGTNAGAAKFVIEALRQRRRVMLEVELAGGICMKFFHCDVIVSRVTDKAQKYWFEMQFIGEPAHVAVARYVHNFLVRAARDCYNVSNPGPRRLYMHAFFEGVAARLIHDRQSYDGSFAIVLADQAAEREAFTRDQLGEVKDSSRKVPSVAMVRQQPQGIEAMMAGYTHGFKTTLRPALGHEQQGELMLA